MMVVGRWLSHPRLLSGVFVAGPSGAGRAWAAPVGTSTQETVEGAIGAQVAVLVFIVVIIRVRAGLGRRLLHPAPRLLVRGF